MMEIRGLAYVVAESSDLDRWVSYARDVLGMMPTKTAGGELLIKMDERQFRFQVESGSNDKYTASGWEVANKEAFDAALKVMDAALFGEATIGLTLPEKPVRTLAGVHHG